MSDKKSLNSKSDITAEACAWIAQIESGSMKADDLAAFKEWITSSPAHKAEIKRLAVLSGELNILTDMATPLKEAAAQHKKLAGFKPKPRWPKFSYITGVIVLLGAIMINQFINTDMPATSQPLLYSTEVGAHREITLSDGTVVDLNTNSEIEVDYNSQRRKVRLLKGEAFFQVTHNKSIPFVVYAEKKSVRAVGTAFVVSLLPKSFEVIVTEGKVELSNTVEDEASVSDKLKSKTAPNSLSPRTAPTRQIKPILLKAGQTLVYDKSASDDLQAELVEVVSQREIRRKLSWQDGILDFSETPLIEVIEDMSRYTSMKIEISDPELRNLKFGGLFRTDELDALFNALEMTFEIKIEKIDDNHVRLSRVKAADA